jgi:hypothetical protein
MTQTDALRVARQIIGWIGTALAVVALAKFVGADIPIRGDVQTTALVAIACMMAR